MPEIPRKLHDDDPLILGLHPSQDVRTLVLTAVVHQNDFILHSQIHQRPGEAAMQRGEVLRLIEHRNDHGQLRSPGRWLRLSHHGREVCRCEGMSHAVGGMFKRRSQGATKSQGLGRVLQRRQHSVAYPIRAGHSLTLLHSRWGWRSALIWWLHGFPYNVRPSGSRQPRCRSAQGISNHISVARESFSSSSCYKAQKMVWIGDKHRPVTRQV